MTIHEVYRFPMIGSLAADCELELNTSWAVHAKLAKYLRASFVATSSLSEVQ